MGWPFASNCGNPDCTRPGLKLQSWLDCAGLDHAGLDHARLKRLVRVIRIARRTWLIARPLSGADVDALLVAGCLIAARLLQFRDEILLVGLLAVLLFAVYEGVREDAAGADMDDPPIVFAGHRVDVFMAQEAEILRALQCVEIGWVFIEFTDVERDRA